jgi:hypothetical protein
MNRNCACTAFESKEPVKMAVLPMRGAGMKQGYKLEPNTGYTASGNGSFSIRKGIIDSQLAYDALASPDQNSLHPM